MRSIINNLYYLILIIFFYYYPIDIMLTYNGLASIHTYYFLIIFSIIILIYIIISSQIHQFNFLKEIKNSFLIFTLILILIIFSYLTNNLNHIMDKTFELYLLYLITYFLIAIFIIMKFDLLVKIFDKNNTIYFFILFNIIYYYLLFYSNNFNFINSFIFGFGTNGAIYLISTIFIIFISLFTIIQNKKYFILLSFFSTILVFTLGSRTGILFFILTLSYTAFKIYGIKKYLLFISSLLIIFFFFNATFSNIFAENERIISLLSLNTQDSSYIARLHQLSNNWTFIKDHYFTGIIMSEYLVGGEGTYIHSYLSYLQNYGIITFTLINILILKLIYLFFKYNIKNDFHIFVNSIFIYTLLEFIFSRSYAYVHLLIFLLIFEFYYSNLKYTNKKDFSCQ
ncbi:MAG: hypothetical protein C0625_15795 [Arcobacter sp.]|nr:MAG: hypothetical protein C0625_15795 [Arcobacter sp.]